MVGWEVCYGVGWEDGEVTGRRVWRCGWLSAKPAVKTEPKTTRTRNSRKWKKSRNSKNKEKQAEMLKTRISQRSRQKKRKSGKQNLRTKLFKQQPSPVKRHLTSWLFKHGNECERRQPTGKAKKLLAGWKGWNMVSCNIMHACVRQQVLPSAWQA